jgi:hypothetical protein
MESAMATTAMDITEARGGATGGDPADKAEANLNKTLLARLEEATAKLAAQDSEISSFKAAQKKRDDDQAAEQKEARSAIEQTMRAGPLAAIIDEYVKVQLNDRKLLDSSVANLHATNAGKPPVDAVAVSKKFLDRVVDATLKGPDDNVELAGLVMYMAGEQQRPRTTAGWRSCNSLRCYKSACATTTAPTCRPGSGCQRMVLLLLLLLLLPNRQKMHTACRACSRGPRPRLLSRCSRRN